MGGECKRKRKPKRRLVHGIMGLRRFVVEVARQGRSFWKGTALGHPPSLSAFPQGQGTARLRAVADEIAERKGDDKGPKAAAKDASLQLELELVRSVIDLHQRYMEYVSGCFSSHTFFHRALKDAFENFCNKPVGQASFAELMATFCDTMLRKGGSDKMSGAHPCSGTTTAARGWRARVCWTRPHLPPPPPQTRRRRRCWSA